MRILVIANNFPWPENPYNGAFNLRQIRALRELGHEVRVLRWVPWAPPFLKARQQYRSVPSRYAVDGVPVHTLRGLLGPRSYGLGTIGIQAAAALRADIAAFAPDVVHAQGLMPAGVLAAECKLPFVVTAHGSETYRVAFARDGLGRAAKGVLRKACAVAAVSSFVGARLRELGARDVSVIFNGADEHIFAPGDRAAARAALGLDPNAPVIAFVGYLQRGKGIYDLIDAAAIMNRRATVLMAGEGDERAEVARYAHDRSVELRLLGAVDQERLVQVYRSADVFTLPSYAEGLPSVICEAMNSAAPVVATNVGGIAEIVEDGVTGYIVEAGDRARLADRLERVLADPQRAASMGNAGYEFARAHLTWKKNALAYQAIYDRIAGQRM